jgi:hypothetical protein
MIPTAIRKRAIWRGPPDRWSLSLFVKPNNFCSNPVAVLKHKDTNGPEVSFLEPSRSKVSLCILAREIVARQFPSECMFSFRCDAAFSPNLQEGFVAEAPISIRRTPLSWA